MRRRVLVPLPDHDFDVTEVAVPWRLLSDAGCEVIFATEAGATPAADPLLLDGVVFGQLGAAEEAKDFYAELAETPRFKQPLTYADIVPGAFDGLLLPGGHAKGMRQYLGSEALHAKVAQFWGLGRPVGAICHGVLVLARSKDESGRSVIAEMRTTCLPKYMERTAFMSTVWRRGRYYRTYSAYVEDEVCDALTNPKVQFERGPRVLSKRGTAIDDSAAFVVQDGRYVSARWPGDAYAFGRAFTELVTAGG
ncbi:MAG: DJ-1/PfpI family protein [Frankiaceae bacterium]|nr:DJ-1/PfpI family protein [Frankiaceae bacterium]